MHASGREQRASAFHLRSPWAIVNARKGVRLAACKSHREDARWEEDWVRNVRNRGKSLRIKPSILRMSGRRAPRIGQV
jgi:hypothetical protein